MDTQNDPPTITMIEPSTNLLLTGADTGTGQTSVVTAWQDYDPDSNADITLFYSHDLSGLKGTAIKSGLKEDPDEECDDTYLWDTGGLADGTYYIYATITDGTFTNTSYAPGSITIQRTAHPASRIPLHSGWNLISFATGTCWYDTDSPPSSPLPTGTHLQRVTSLKEVLHSIEGKYAVLNSFDQEGGHTFDPVLDGSGFNDLHYLSPGYGYWIKMTGPAVLELDSLSTDTSSLDPSASLSLHTGWNLAGFWGGEAWHDLPAAPAILLPEGIEWLATPSLMNVLLSIDGRYSVISAFDQEGGHTFDPSLDGSGFNDLHYLSPGYGYWIKMTGPGELYY